MSGLPALIALVSFGIALYAIVTLPSWLLASMNRGTLWNLRDAAFDARRRGQLPDSEDTERLIERMETFIRVLPDVSAFRVWWLSRDMTWGRRSEGHVLWIEPAFHEAKSRELFMKFQTELARIVARQYMLCSWSGLTMVAPRHRDVVRHVLHRNAHFEKWSWGTIPASDCDPGLSSEVRKYPKDVTDRVGHVFVGHTSDTGRLATA